MTVWNVAVLNVAYDCMERGLTFYDRMERGLTFYDRMERGLTFLIVWM